MKTTANNNIMQHAYKTTNKKMKKQSIYGKDLIIFQPQFATHLWKEKKLET